AVRPTTKALRESTRRNPPKASTAPCALTLAPRHTASAATMANAMRLSRSSTTRLRNGQQARPVSKGTSTRSVSSMARSFLALTNLTECSPSASWQSSNDAHCLFHQLADARGQPHSEQQQRPKRQAHGSDVARRNNFTRMFAIARTEQ